MSAHRDDCRFGPGFYRILLEGGARRYCQTEREVRAAMSLLERERVTHVQRDACLDEPDERGVVDGERFLAMSAPAAMAAIGIEAEADYVRAYRALEDALLERDKRTSAGEPKPSVVIKRRGVKVSDV
jgi:hypothetical protein